MPESFDLFVGGVDIGASKIAVGLASAIGRPVRRETLPNQPVEPMNVVADRVCECFLRLLAREGVGLERVLGVGIGCPGPLDVRTGRILEDATLPGWAGLSITELLSRRLGLPCAIENDADAALLGEIFLGAAQGESSACILTIGTGVGGAVWMDGRLLRGVRAEHPEIGHVPVIPDGPDCYCGQNGCLESVAGGASLSRCAASLGLGDAAGLFAAAARGEPGAARVVSRAAEGIAQAVSILAHAFAPRIILIGGGIGEKHYPALTGAAQRLLSRLRLVRHLEIALRPAALGNRAGLLGACRIGLEAARTAPIRTPARGFAP